MVTEPLTRQQFLDALATAAAELEGRSSDALADIAKQNLQTVLGLQRRGRLSDQDPVECLRAAVVDVAACCLLLFEKGAQWEVPADE